MPFAEPFPRAFSIRSIHSHAPSAPGLYGICNARQWILIEGTDDIHGSLLAHACEQNGAVNAHAPTGFRFELCDAQLQASRQNQLVMEYEPIGNRLPRR